MAKCVRQPIGNTMKIKTEVVRHPNKGARKWKTVYVAVPISQPTFPLIQIMEEKQADAIIRARAYIEKHPNIGFRIQIGKTLIGEKGEECVAEVKYKSSSKERDGIWEVYGSMPY